MAFVNIDWLSRWVETPKDLNAEQLAADLVKVGLEEELIHSSGITGPIVKGVCISREEFEASNGKKIGYCRVDVGPHNDTENDVDKELSVGTRGIICGAPNLQEGDVVCVCLPGAVLPGDFEIAARKTYGHISNGMICSERELGLGDNHDGIIRLQESRWADEIEKLELGDDVKGVLGLDNEILEINITPDRGYCFSYRGVAREYALSTSSAFKDLVIDYSEKAEAQLEPGSDKLVVLDDISPIHGVQGCSVFVGATVKGVKSDAETPSWMKKFLESNGMRSISLPVDVTNYVMMDFGQPLHAYDLDQVEFPIVVRRAKADETIETLDDKARKLDAEDLLITDSKGGNAARPIGVAGVMGGASTEVTNNTKNIFLEAAYFEPVTISRSARRHKLPSEASKRFERGIDPTIQGAAAFYAAQLLVEFGGATLEKLEVVKGDDPEVTSIKFDPAIVKKVLGIDVPESEISTILKNIGCEIKGDVVVSPPWRPDLDIPQALVEEVARIHGYDKVPNVLPNAPHIVSKSLTKTEKSMDYRRDVSNSLAARGFVEVLTYPFTNKGTVQIQNPLAGDKPFLRETLLETTLEAAKLNISRNNNNVKIFEIGKVFRSRVVGEKPILGEIPSIEGGTLPDKKTLGTIAKLLPNQPTHLCGVFADGGSSNKLSNKWALAINEVNKVLLTAGVDASVAGRKGSAKIEQLPLHSKEPILPFTKRAFHPTRSADITINDEIVGRAGELHPTIVKEYQLPSGSAAFELDFDKLAKFQSPIPFKAKVVQTFPPASEDYAFIVPDEIPASTIQKAIEKGVRVIEDKTKSEILESVRLFDEFKSDKIEAGKKSLSFAVVLRTDHTFENSEIQSVRQSILDTVKGEGGDLRL
jgi:phenylalanyl-tRNA synthetase beta chain